MYNTFEIQTAQNVTLSLEFASLGDRILAYIIDVVVKAVYIGIVSVVIGLIAQGSNGNFNIIIPIVIFAILPILFYSLLLEIFYNGQTIGKKAMSLQVASLDGDEVSIGQYFQRWLFRFLDFSTLWGLIALICVATSEKSQRIGDMVAGTTVIKLRNQYNVRSTIYQDQREDYIPIYPEVKQLHAKEITLVKEVLDSRELERNAQHIEILADRLAGHMNVDYIEHPRVFLRTLLKDYSYFRQ